MRTFQSVSSAIFWEDSRRSCPAPDAGKRTKKVKALLMAPSCEDYRYQQQLLGLKKRLAEEDVTAEEREEIERLIQELEEKLRM